MKCSIGTINGIRPGFCGQRSQMIEIGRFLKIKAKELE